MVVLLVATRKHTLRGNNLKFIVSICNIGTTAFIFKCLLFLLVVMLVMAVGVRYGYTKQKKNFILIWNDGENRCLWNCINFYLISN